MISALLILALTFLYLYQKNPDTAKEFIHKSIESGLEEAENSYGISPGNDLLQDSVNVGWGNENQQKKNQDALEGLFRASESE